MTADKITQLAQQNPVRQLTSRLGELKEQADREVANLSMTLKALDDTRDILKAHGLTMTVDLGDIGNAAGHARRASLADAAAHAFTLPTERVA